MILIFTLKTKKAWKLRVQTDKKTLRESNVKTKMHGN